MSNVGRELDTVVMSTGDDTGGRKVDQCGAVGSADLMRRLITDQQRKKEKKRLLVIKQRKGGLTR